MLINTDTLNGTVYLIGTVKLTIHAEAQYIPVRNLFGLSYRFSGIQHIKICLFLSVTQMPHGCTKAVDDNGFSFSSSASPVTVSFSNSSSALQRTVTSLRK